MTLPKRPARLMRAVCCCLCLPALWPGVNARAGLMTLGTRIVYPADSHGRTLQIANTNPWPVLVQTWVDQGEGDPAGAHAPFVVLPAIFRLEPSASQNLRIIHTGAPLPEDRESLFWLNLHEVPPTGSTADPDEARLTLTLNTQLKILYRPTGMPAPVDLASQLQFRLERQDGRWCVRAHNPAPWHASITALGVDGMDGRLTADEADLLLPPFTTRRYRLNDGQPVADAALHLHLIGDEGYSEEHERILSQ